MFLCSLIKKRNFSSRYTVTFPKLLFLKGNLKIDNNKCKVFFFLGEYSLPPTIWRIEPNILIANRLEL